MRWCPRQHRIGCALTLLPPTPTLALVLSAASHTPHKHARNHRLNYINDFDPVSHQFKQPIYAIEAGVTKTGTLECYKPKGAWDNPTKRNWLKYEVSSSGCVAGCVCRM